MGMRDRMRTMKQFQDQGGLNPGAKLAKPKLARANGSRNDERRKMKKQRERNERRRRWEDRHKGNGSG